MPGKEKELRCFCRYKPLLATYGIDEGKLFVHIKIYKKDRIYGNIVCEGGVVKVQCRDCGRWHRVNIIGRRANLREVADPHPERVAG